MRPPRRTPRRAALTLSDDLLSLIQEALRRADDVRCGEVLLRRRVPCSLPVPSTVLVFLARSYPQEVTNDHGFRRGLVAYAAVTMASPRAAALLALAAGAQATAYSSCHNAVMAFGSGNVCSTSTPTSYSDFLAWCPASGGNTEHGDDDCNELLGAIVQRCGSSTQYAELYGRAQQKVTYCNVRAPPPNGPCGRFPPSRAAPPAVAGVFLHGCEDISGRACQLDECQPPGGHAAWARGLRRRAGRRHCLHECAAPRGVGGGSGAPIGTCAPCVPSRLRPGDRRLCERSSAPTACASPPPSLRTPAHTVCARAARRVPHRARRRRYGLRRQPDESVRSATPGGHRRAGRAHEDGLRPDQRRPPKQPGLLRGACRWPAKPTAHPPGSHALSRSRHRAG